MWAQDFRPGACAMIRGKSGDPGFPCFLVDFIASVGKMRA
jgi:hypothetical protein